MYYRFHGVPHLYRLKYDISIRQRISNEIEGNTGVKEAFIYFNNDIDASAIRNAIEISEYKEGYKQSSKM